MNRLAWLLVVLLSLCVGFRDCQAEEFPKALVALVAEQLPDRIRALMDVEAGVYPLAGDEGRIESIVVVSETDLWRNTTLPEQAARELAEQAAEYEAYGSFAKFLQSQVKGEAGDNSSQVLTAPCQSVPRLRSLASVIDDGMLKKAFLWRTDDREDKDLKPVEVNIVKEERTLTQRRNHNTISQDETTGQIVVDGACVIRRQAIVIVGEDTTDDASESMVQVFEQRSRAGECQLLLLQTSDSLGALSVTGVWITADGKAVSIGAK